LEEKAPAVAGENQLLLSCTRVRPRHTREKAYKTSQNKHTVNRSINFVAHANNTAL